MLKSQLCAQHQVSDQTDTFWECSVVRGYCRLYLPEVYSVVRSCYQNPHGRLIQLLLLKYP